MQFITIIIMGSLAGSEIDLFVPSFPELQSTFFLSPSLVELTLSINFTAYCFCSLLAGELGDRFGRKPLIQLGLLVFIAGSLLCAFAPYFWTLIAGRFLQGVGIAGPAVLAYVIIADQYPPEQQQRILGVLNGVITLSMASAPVLGSYISVWLGWRGNFIFLLLLSVICFLMGHFFIHEHKDNIKNNEPLSFAPYIAVFKSPLAMSYTAAVCLLVIPYWVFIGISPILYMEDLGVSLQSFGFYQGGLAVVFSIFSLSSAYLLNAYGTKNCFRISMTLCLIATIFIIIFIIMNTKNPLLITCGLLVLSAGVVVPVNILYPRALETVADSKGRIAALILSIRLIFTAFSLQIAGFFYDGSFRPIGTIMTLSLVLFFLLIAFMAKKNTLILKENEEPTLPPS